MFCNSSFWYTNSTDLLVYSTVLCALVKLNCFLHFYYYPEPDFNEILCWNGIIFWCLNSCCQVLREFRHSSKFTVKRPLFVNLKHVILKFLSISYCQTAFSACLTTLYSMLIPVLPGPVPPVFIGRMCFLVSVSSVNYSATNASHHHLLGFLSWSNTKLLTKESLRHPLCWLSCIGC